MEVAQFTAEQIEAVVRVLPWLAPIVPFIPVIRWLYKSYQGSVKKIADDALAEEKAEKLRCDARVAEAEAKVIDRMKVDADEREARYNEKLEALEARVGSQADELVKIRGTVLKSRTTMNRVVRAFYAMGSDPDGLRAAIEELVRTVDEIEL